MKTLNRCASVIALVFAHSVAAAQTTCTAPSVDCVAVGKLSVSASVGLGTRTNPLVSGNDIPLIAVPHLSYYGERFFIEDLELGFMLFETRSQTLNLIAAPGYDRVFFARRDPQNFFLSSVGGTAATPPGQPPPDPGTPPPEPIRIGHRKTTYLAGPEWSYNRGPLAAQVSALYEVTGVHDGYEVRGALAMPLGRESGFSVTTGFTWKSTKVANYYYGVDQRYAAHAALNPFLRVAYAKPLGERVTLRAFAHYEHLGSAIADSPIIVDDHVVTVFAGIDFRIL
jgi:outer membrane protein